MPIRSKLVISSKRRLSPKAVKPPAKAVPPVLRKPAKVLSWSIDPRSKEGITLDIVRNFGFRGKCCGGSK